MNDLTENQKQFVKDAQGQGLEVDYTYSGRFMYGDTCPSVVVRSPSEFNTSANTEWDNMGLNYVVYARR